LGFSKVVFSKKAVFPVALLGGALGFFLFSSVTMAASPVVPSPEKAARESLASHEAVYDIRMSSSKSGAQILDIRGKMLYSLKKSCVGWITDHRFTMSYEYSDAPAIQVETRFASFESYDGQVMDFSSSRSRNGEIYEEVRGKARIGEAVSKDNFVLYSMPKNLRYDLQGATLFPMAHTYKLIDSARQGKRVVNEVVFDGSDDQGPVEINAVIGKQKVNRDDSRGSSKFVDGELLKAPYWPMQLAVFPMDSSSSLADYELSMDVLENGIVRDMNVDYHDFSISQKLVALKSVPPEECKE